jgi:hypothetical protein
MRLQPPTRDKILMVNLRTEFTQKLYRHLELHDLETQRTEPSLRNSKFALLMRDDNWRDASSPHCSWANQAPSSSKIDLNREPRVRSSCPTTGYSTLTPGLQGLQDTQSTVLACQPSSSHHACTQVVGNLGSYLTWLVRGISRNWWSVHGVPALERTGFLKRVVCLSLIPLTLYVIVLYSFLCFLRSFSWHGRRTRAKNSGRRRPE